MESVLSDGEVIGDLATHDESLWEKVKAWILQAIGKIRAAYKGLKPESNAGRAMAEVLAEDGTLSELERIFSEGVKDAGARKRAAEIADGESQTVGILKYSDEETIHKGLMDFRKSVISMQSKSEISKRKKKIGSISDNHKQIVENVIKKETGKSVDLSGYELWIDGSAILHIEDRHGKNGESDHSMENPKDVARIPWAANNAEVGRIGRKQNGSVDYSSVYTNKDGTPSPVIVLEKDIGNGRMIVAECAPDAGAKIVHVISARIEKIKEGGRGQELNVEPKSSPQPTSETLLDGGATNHSISHTAPPVNSQTKKSLKFSLGTNSEQSEAGQKAKKDKPVDVVGQKAGAAYKEIDAWVNEVFSGDYSDGLSDDAGLSSTAKWTIRKGIAEAFSSVDRTAMTCRLRRSARNI